MNKQLKETFTALEGAWSFQRKIFNTIESSVETAEGIAVFANDEAKYL